MYIKINKTELATKLAKAQTEAILDGTKFIVELFRRRSSSL